jgi:23S rRNA (uracil1939-C5)-methyltransferase
VSPVRVESLDHEGRGIAHADGKVIFIEGALPGETVTYASHSKKPSYEFAKVVDVLRASPQRTAPRCPHFGICGGCSLQHLDARAQVAVKQRILEDALAHIGKVGAESMLPAVHGVPWGYRGRARLSVRFVPKKGGALVGFHEKRSSYVADMRSWDILPPRISGLLMPLRELVNAWSRPDRLPQIELAAGDGVYALVLRVLEPPTGRDEELVRAFADRHGVQFFWQPRGPESATPYYPSNEGEISYRLAEFGLEIGFSPTEFTQVNASVNEVLVRRAMSLLDPKSGERIADMFCGVGNFTLAIARSGAKAVGIEGADSLIKRARMNAERNGLNALTRFERADLFKVDAAWWAALGRFDSMLVDPPRDGAVELLKAMGETGDAAPRRIVYVSCNPATLARDAAVLVHVQGYALKAAGVLNMFPHTAHVESIALFER